MRIQTRVILTSMAVMVLVLAAVWAANRLVYVHDLYEEQQANARSLLRLAMANLDTRYGGLREGKLELVSQVRLQLAAENNAVLDLLSAIRQTALENGSEEQARAAAREHLLRNRKHFENLVICGGELAPVFLPDPATGDVCGSGARDLRGNDAFVEMRAEVRRTGECYSVVYWPPSPGSPDVKHLVHARLFEPWDWLVCVYEPIPDIEGLVEQRKTAILEELEDLSRHLMKAGQGYLMVADGGGRMLVHPWHPAGDVTPVLDLDTGRPLFELFQEAAQDSGQLEYAWRPGPEVQEALRKVAYVQWFRPLDWYVAYTVDKQSLEAPARRLARAESAIIAAILLLASGLLYYFLRRFTRPLREVSAALSDLPRRGFRMEEGELDVLESRHARSGDETASLLATFRQMQQRLNRYVDDLDAAIREKDAYAEELGALNRDLDRRVQERTEALSRANLHLQEEAGQREQAERSL
ncbi:MAG: cache domain-containing protein, partial [Desulfovibrionaceae bacterium]